MSSTVFLCLCTLAKCTHSTGLKKLPSSILRALSHGHAFLLVPEILRSLALSTCNSKCGSSSSALTCDTEQIGRCPWPASRMKPCSLFSALLLTRDHRAWALVKSRALCMGIESNLRRRACFHYGKRYGFIQHSERECVCLSVGPGSRR